MNSRIKEILANPLQIFFTLGHRGLLNWMSDERYLKIGYRIRRKKKLNFDNPQTFNEKLQWLKIHDRKPEYTMMVDKYEVKKYVAEKIGEEYIIPTLGVWDRFDDIDFDSLPNQFVLKCTHDSGGLVICKDKSRLDIKAARKKINASMKRSFYLSGREWPYKNVKPRIIAEKYMQDATEINLPVYKFFCFDGQPKIIQSIKNDKMPNESIDYFDTDWNLLNIKQSFPNSEIPLPKPENLSELVAFAGLLAKDKVGFLRVDLYVINRKIYFSEYTFYSDCGFERFYPDEWDRKLGDWIKLP